MSSLTSFQQKALAYEKEKNYEDAIECHFACLNIALKSHSEIHPEVIECYDNIGRVFHYQNKFPEALNNLQNSLRMKLELYPESHPSILTSIKNLGILYKAEKRYEEALEKFNRYLSLIDDGDSDILLEVFESIAAIHEKLNCNSQAFEWYKKALNVRLKTGRSSQQTSTLLLKCGAILYKQAKYDLALKYLKKSLNFALRELENNHPKVGRIFNQIGVVYQGLKKYDEALQFQFKFLNCILLNRAENKELLGTCYTTLGTLYKQKQEFSLAMEYFEKALELGAQDDLSKASCYNEIACIFFQQANYDKAIEWHRKTLAIKKKYCQDNQLSLAKTYNNLGMAYQKNGNFDDALINLSKSLNMKLKYEPENYLSILTSHKNIASTYESVSKFTEAIDHYNKAMSFGSHFNDEIFPDLYSSIGGIFLKLGRKDEAFELYKKGYIIQQRKLGDDHFMTKQTKNILHQNFQQEYSSLS